MVTAVPARRRSIGTSASQRATASMVSGCSVWCRLSVSSWLVMTAAWLPASWMASTGSRSDAVRAEPVQQDLAVAQDHRQQVVEVVRHPAGQRRDRFEPLRLRRAGLQAACDPSCR